MARLRVACVTPFARGLDEREQRMAGVVGRDGIGGGRRAWDRDAEAAVRVAALPRVGEGRGLSAPGAVGDLERLTLPGQAGDRRLRRRYEDDVALPRSGR